MEKIARLVLTVDVRPAMEDLRLGSVCSMEAGVRQEKRSQRPVEERRDPSGKSQERVSNSLKNARERLRLARGQGHERFEQTLSLLRGPNPSTACSVIVVTVLKCLVVGVARNGQSEPRLLLPPSPLLFLLGEDLLLDSEDVQN